MDMDEYYLGIILKLSNQVQTYDSLNVCLVSVMMFICIQWQKSLLKVQGLIY